MGVLHSIHFFQRVVLEEAEPLRVRRKHNLRTHGARSEATNRGTAGAQVRTLKGLAARARAPMPCAVKQLVEGFEPYLLAP